MGAGVPPGGRNAACAAALGRPPGCSCFPLVDAVLASKAVLRTAVCPPPPPGNGHPINQLEGRTPLWSGGGDPTLAVVQSGVGDQDRLTLTVSTQGWGASSGFY